VKFESAAANDLLAELTASVEPPRIAAARKLIARAQPGAQRREVADKLFTELAESGAPQGEYLAVWELAREAEEGEVEETSPRPPDKLERQLAEREQQRRQIIAAGYEPVFHVGEGVYRAAVGDYMLETDDETGEVG
jgi:hypothetical protein